MREREQKPFGLLFPNDVFLYNDVAYQKREGDTAFAPSLQESRRFLLTTVVEFVGYGIWPSSRHADIATDES